MIGAESGRLALFRLDASPQIGGGHAFRCLALAQALATAGWRCAFAGTNETLETVPALAQWPFIALPPASRDGGSREAAALAAAAGRADLLVVDHYGRGAAFETDCRAFARTVLAIEDLPDRRHDCDLLLDVAPDRVAADYRGRVPPECRLMLGPSYALLHNEFAIRRAEAGLLGDSGRLLVSVGATDAANATALVLTGLERSHLPDGSTVDVALTSAAPHLPEIRRRVAEARHRMALHVDPPSMSALMAGADFAIGAGGSAAWERCCLGLPSILLTLADNQRPNARALERAGAALTLDSPPNPASVARAVSDLAADPDRLRSMAAAARRLCDGRGAGRVVAEIDPPRARDGGAVALRPAGQDNADDLLAWRSDPSTRAFARNPQAPTPEEHVRWLDGKLGDPGCLLNIILHGDVPAGTVRLDAIRGDRPTYEVSITIAADSRRRGVGRAAMALARQLVPEASLRAYVMSGNDASRALFSDCGFVATEQPDWFVAPPLATNLGAEANAPRDPVPVGTP